MPPEFPRVPRLAVLISGRGSNLQAIIDAIGDRRLHAEIAVVVSDQPDAPGLTRAAAAGLATRIVRRRDYATRHEFDGALAAAVLEQHVDLVCLAGFMRLLGTGFLDAFPDRVVNIHPSLLPAFPGLDAPQQAFAHGVKVAGATVHLVTADLDAGPIVLQRAVAVDERDTAASLAARILAEEHRLYPEAIQLLLHGRWRLEGRRFVNEELRTKD